ncbi:MAG TPA: RDD family protein [Acidimicrobiia bacterium]|nr:RDD family protein [Acidimicrobiia bacterium]
MDRPPAAWYPDPSGRYQLRYWDGHRWTGHVSTRGTVFHDSPAAAARPADALAPVAGAMEYPPALDVPLASLGARFGVFVLEGILQMVTLFVGWLIWACFTFRTGQTPAKALVGQRVVRQDSGQAATWGDMFLREAVLKGGLTLLSFLTLGVPFLVAAGLIFAGSLRQTGWDRLAGTLVVDDRDGETVPAPFPSAR